MFLFLLLLLSLSLFEFYTDFSDIVDRTCIKRDDVIATLSHLNVLYYVKGQHVIYLSRDLIQAHQKAMQRRNLRVDAKLLNWKSRDWSKRGRW